MVSKMAREDDFEEKCLEEMPPCLRDLFEQTSCEQGKRFANSPRSLTESPESILEIGGMKLPPPMLTVEERAEMRQYRREAVKCEARMFERRREKYSDLILQVMSVMDRIQEQRETKHGTQSVQERTLTSETGDENKCNGTLHHSSLQTTIYKPDYGRQIWDVPRSGRNSKQEQYTKSFLDWTGNHGDQSKRVCSQLSYSAHPVESAHITADKIEVLKHQLPGEKHGSEVASVLVGFEPGHDLLLCSTMDNNVSDIKRPFSQLSAVSNGMFSDSVSDMSLSNKQMLYQLDRRGVDRDSLASTSLSMAFSDSSNATVYSVIGKEPRSITHQLTQEESESSGIHRKSHHEPQSSTAQLKYFHTNTRPVSAQPKPEKQNLQASSVSNGPLLSDQDKTLANLEKLREKLLEEKQKHLDALKQQELKRLRKQWKDELVEVDHTYASSQTSTPTHIIERPRSSSMPSTRTSDFKQLPGNDHVIDRSSPLRRHLSMPPGEMYSILELSGENLDFDAHDHNIEPESSSDKENHVLDEDLSVYGSDAVAERIRQNIGTQGTHTALSRRRNCKPSTVPREVFKFFESDGRDKFAKLSAHAKGFLARCLMKTDKVQGLVKTIKDTRDVLEEMSKEDTQTMQEKKLKENVESHLKVARGNLHDVFFKIPMKERMSFIAHSRSLAQAKQAKRVTRSAASHSKLSAVTLKAIQRRQEGLEISVRQPEIPEVKRKSETHEERKRKTWNIRVLKPQQGHSSPPLPDRTRSKKQTSRPTTAPERPLNSKTHKEHTVKRPQTAEPTRGNPERPSRMSLGIGKSNQQAKRPGRKSLGGINQQPKMVGALASRNRTVQPRAQKRLSLPESAQPRMRGQLGTEHVMHKPKTTCEAKRSSRTLAANFSK